MNDFSLIPLGDVATFRNGLNFNKSSDGQKIKIIGVSDFKNRLTPNYEELEVIQIDGKLGNEDYLHFGDIVFVRSNGNKALVARSLFIDKDEELSFSGFCIKARIVDETLLLRKYFSYFTKTSQFRYAISKGTIGTNINNLNQGILSDLKVPAPDIATQQVIVSFLSDLDSKIELNNRINAELEAMAKTIYDYWFVQFDFPISKELATQMGKPELEGRPYKSSGGKMVYNKELKREVTEGWEVKKITDFIEVRDGTHDSPKRSTTGKFLITSKHLTKSGVDFSTAYLISNEDYIAVNKRSKVDQGDILISMIGTIGNIYYVQDSEIDFAIKNMGLFKTSQNKDLADYIYSYVESAHGQQYFLSSISGSIQNYLTLGVLRNTPLLIPSQDHLDKFNSIVRPIYGKIHSNNQENQELASLRDWLLPMLMNGQVKVGEVKTNKATYTAQQELDDLAGRMAAERREKYEVKE
ncbi:restriction endonuclease subunit S [Owenweeksia hongkongensis]|uniref:restriction endonuclease subunit S n=1 Tax=Owenweeksia hongkongensis TaxID=253245 RepID=UPI003A942161